LVPGVKALKISSSEDFLETSEKKRKDAESHLIRVEKRKNPVENKNEDEAGRKGKEKGPILFKRKGGDGWKKDYNDMPKICEEKNRRPPYQNPL